MKKINMKSNQNLTLEEGFNQFIKMCKIKNLSPKTELMKEVQGIGEYRIDCGIEN